MGRFVVKQFPSTSAVIPPDRVVVAHQLADREVVGEQTALDAEDGDRVEHQRPVEVT